MTDIYMFATRPWQCLSYATHHLLLTFVCVTKDIWAFATFLQRCQLPFFLSFVFYCIYLYFLLPHRFIFHQCVGTGCRFSADGQRRRGSSSSECSRTFAKWLLWCARQSNSAYGCSNAIGCAARNVAQERIYIQTYVYISAIQKSAGSLLILMRVAMHLHNHPCICTCTCLIVFQFVRCKPLDLCRSVDCCFCCNSIFVAAI